MPAKAKAVTVQARSSLNMGLTLTLPADMVTQSAAILAVRRAGKSNTGAVLAEEMYYARLPWAAIDPKGDWWGLRASGDGQGPGLAVPVFGGLHGDLPLTPESGHLIAEIIVAENLTCILDVSDFPSKAAQMRFLADFGEHLFRLHRKDPQPRHLFLEEADEYLPQRVMQDQTRCVGVWSRLVKQGGSFGLGVTLLSQRSAVVNKDVLTQAETLIAMRTTSPQDRAAIKAWVDYHAQSREIVESLPSLADGEGWVISPQWLVRHGQPAVQRVKFRQRSTFDSGATPTMTRRAQRPATLADINLGALLKRMDALIKAAEVNDPVVLRRRIGELERQLATRQPAEAAELRAQVAALTDQLNAERARPPERIEVPVLSPGDMAALEQAVTGLRDITGGIELALAQVSRPAAATMTRPPVVRPRAAPGAARQEPASGNVPHLKAGAMRMLTALARQHPVKVTRGQLATLGSVKKSGGTFGSYFSALRTNGLITEENGLVLITPAGLAAAGVEPGEPMTAAEIREQWRSALKAGARAMLDHLLAVYPASVSRAELAEAAGIEQGGGTFGSYLSTLRSNGLAEVTGDQVCASGVFFMAEHGG
jgi:hypothetical protein